MNIKLTNHIINHVFDNLGLTLDTSKSIKEFLLKETIDFINEYEKDDYANIYGIEIKIDSGAFRIAAVEFSNIEYALIMKLDNCPTYACYLNIDSITGEPYDGLICFSFNKNEWLKTNIAIQATFLAGMENLKDVIGITNKLIKPQDLIEELKSFIVYYNSIEY